MMRALFINYNELPMMSQHQTWVEEINAAPSLQDLEAIRVRLLGKNGEITGQLKTLGKLAPEERKKKGLALNELKQKIAQVLDTQKAVLADQALTAKLEGERVDVTLPVYPSKEGSLHPIMKTIDDVVSYFSAYGFSVEEGPDIEDQVYNFTHLNIPEHHPARQDHDTFYMKPQGDGARPVLRTHTSPVQIRTMMAEKPPFRILAPGRTYRCDHDATHTPMFHQFEGLLVDKGMTMGHLKSCIIDFCRSFFDREDLPVRFRPSFFPFTEPSAEVDIGCSKKEGVLKIGAGDDWLEILGCGMVHPNVLRNCGVDPDTYQGFAFGCGVERLAMLKYGIPDVRDMYAGDVRWLKHYGFSPFNGSL